MTSNYSSFRRRYRILALGIALVFVVAMYSEVRAQGGPQPTDGTSGGGDPETTTETEKKDGLNLLVLLTKGGWFMVPLGGLSVLVLAISIERYVATRKSRVLPAGLINDLGALGSAPGGFDPRDAYRVCQQYPSAASKVIRAMLFKVGRPQAELEHAVSEASQREGDRMHTNVQWVSLVASVAPLVGLLGTVWGITRAFYDTTQLVEGQNKAEELAEGIYTALITTMCGLMIAIPAAIFAQYFESRITSLFHRIDELVSNLLPQVERFEGKVRFSRSDGDMDGDHNGHNDPTGSRGTVARESSVAGAGAGRGDPRPGESRKSDPIRTEKHRPDANRAGGARASDD